MRTALSLDLLKQKVDTVISLAPLNQDVGPESLTLSPRRKWLIPYKVFWTKIMIQISLS